MNLRIVHNLRNVSRSNIKIKLFSKPKSRDFDEKRNNLARNTLIVRFHRTFIVQFRILLTLKLNISVSSISKKKDFTERGKMVIHLGRYVHFADSSWLNREQTSAGQRWRCMPFFTFPLVGIRERERGRYTSYLSFAYRHCSRHTDKQCPAIRSPF